MENRYGATTPSLTSSAGHPTSSQAMRASALMGAIAMAANGPTAKTATATTVSATDKIVSTEASLVCMVASCVRKNGPPTRTMRTSGSLSSLRRLLGSRADECVESVGILRDGAELD